MAKQDDYTRYTIRIPTPLYERVKAAAGEASVNSLVVATLEEKYPPPFSIQEDAILAASAGLLFHQGGGDGRGSKLYREVLRFMRQELGLHDPEQAISELKLEIAIQNITLAELDAWLDRRFRPWLAEHPDA